MVVGDAVATRVVVVGFASVDATTADERGRSTEEVSDSTVVNFVDEVVEAVLVVVGAVFEVDVVVGAVFVVERVVSRRSVVFAGADVVTGAEACDVAFSEVVSETEVDMVDVIAGAAFVVDEVVVWRSVVFAGAEVVAEVEACVVASSDVVLETEVDAAVVLDVVAGAVFVVDEVVVWRSVVFDGAEVVAEVEACDVAFSRAVSETEVDVVVVVDVVAGAAFVVDEVVVWRSVVFDGAEVVAEVEACDVALSRVVSETEVDVVVVVDVVAGAAFVVDEVVVWRSVVVTGCLLYTSPSPRDS